MNGRVLFPPIVRNLLIANIAIYLLQAAGGLSLLAEFALWPLGTPEYVLTQQGPLAVPQFHPWQLLSYAFLHANFTHLFLNLFAIWMFGTRMEQVWGSARFAVYYLVCIVGAGLTQLLVLSPLLNPEGLSINPTVGASGGVFGILLAFGMRFPEERLLLLFPPIPVKAKYFVIGYGALELLFGVTGTLSGVAHFAHLGGMLFGGLLMLYWRRQQRHR